MKAIAKPAPGCLLRADNTPGSRIVCQNPIPVLGQDQAGSEGLITDETCSSSKNVLTLTLNEGNFKNDLQLMKMNCKTATRTRKIVNWSFVSKFKDFISAESLDMLQNFIKVPKALIISNEIYSEEGTTI